MQSTGNLSSILAVLCVFALAMPCKALEREAIVTLFAAHQPLSSVFIAGPARVFAPSQLRAHAMRPYDLGSGLYELQHEGDRFKIKSIRAAAAAPQFLQSDEIVIKPSAAFLKIGMKTSSLRRYRGTLSIRSAGPQLKITNQVQMKDYVASVVGSESMVQFPVGALKAQSVLVQTAMVRYKKGDELNDSTEKQAYLGADYERAAVLESVRKTWGQTLSCDGKPVPIYFHAACAGGTSTSAIFTGKATALTCDVSVKCDNCRQSPFWQPTRHKIPGAIFSAKFPKGLPRVEEKDKAGRPLLLKYADGSQESGYAFWLKVGQKFGWDKMPGTRFEIKKLASGDLELSSTGAGHGVGLCQWGACGLAKSGMTYERILEYYFPGAKLRGQ